MHQLTQRQRQVAELVALSYTNKQIAALIRITPRRVQRIIASIAEQMGAHTDRDERVQIALRWVEEQRKAG